MLQVGFLAFKMLLLLTESILFTDFTITYCCHFTEDKSLMLMPKAMPLKPHKYLTSSLCILNPIRCLPLQKYLTSQPLYVNVIPARQKKIGNLHKKSITGSIFMYSQKQDPGSQRAVSLAIATGLMGNRGKLGFISNP